MARKAAAPKANAPASPYLRESLLKENTLLRNREPPDHYLAVNQEPSSRRRAGRPSNRSKNRMSAASEVEDLDEKPLLVEEKTHRFPQQVLKKVVIPVNGRSSIASSLSSVRDNSSGYDTPGTSVVVTPAESLMKGARSTKRPSRVSSSTFYQPEDIFKGKRKRLEVDEFIEADEILAQRLQEQEYSEDQDVAPTLRRIRNAPIEDSEDSLLSDLSREHLPDPDELDIPASATPNRRRVKTLPPQAALTDIEDDRSQQESIDEDEISETFMPRRKRVRTSHRTALPSRAARDSANKSIKNRKSSRILDSEESDLSNLSDDVSLFSSDVDSDAFQDSEDADEEADDVMGVANSHTTTVAANSPSSVPTAIPSTGRRGAGRRGASSAQATNSTRGRRSWQRRVEDRVSSEVVWPQVHG